MVRCARGDGLRKQALNPCTATADHALSLGKHKTLETAASM